MKSVFKKSLKLFFISLSLIFVIGGFFSVITIIKYKNEVEFDKEKLTSCTTKLNIYDNENKLINYTSINGNKVISLKELPDYVKNSFITIEDKNFYKHNGINLKRMVKAFVTNIVSKGYNQGASTISQQLIKNTHLSSEKTLERKIKEVMLTFQLEKECSKDEILETYLNVIYFGNSAYGIEDASLTYFNKSSKYLTISEAAGLAGIIKSPQTYSPIYNYNNFINRRNLVLENLYKDKYITKSQFEEAKNEKINVFEGNLLKNRKVFENAVISEACKLLNCSEKDIATMGLKIYSTQNSNIQKSIIETVSNKNYYVENRNGITPNSCMVCLNSKTGAVEGFYGNGNFNFYTFKRQPGSAIKPILVYAPALENNLISPLTKIDNSRIDIDGYSPQNVGSNNKDFVSVTESLCDSLNIPAIKVLDYVGINKATNFAKNNGINLTKDDENLNIALGGLTKGVNIVDLASSYTALANNGYYSKPYFIEKITTKLDRVIFSNKKVSTPSMREDTAYLLTNMLMQATKVGTSKRLKDFSFDIAGKTGTVGVSNTNYNTDAWSVAYTTKNILCSWIGNGDGKSESTLEGNNNGGTYATNMVKEVISNIYYDNKPTNFIIPNTVKEVEIDAIKYEKNNEIVLANSKLKECYKQKGLFSIYNLPQNSDNETQTNLSCEIIDNKATITFSAYPTNDYVLYRIVNGKKEKLTSCSNCYKEISFIDSNLPLNTDFYYELEYYIDNSTNFESTDNFYIEKQQKKWFL